MAWRIQWGGGQAAGGPLRGARLGRPGELPSPDPGALAEPLSGSLQAAPGFPAEEPWGPKEAQEWWGHRLKRGSLGGSRGLRLNVH